MGQSLNWNIDRQAHGVTVDHEGVEAATATKHALRQIGMLLMALVRTTLMALLTMPAAASRQQLSARSQAKFASNRLLACYKTDVPPLRYGPYGLLLARRHRWHRDSFQILQQQGTWGVPEI